MRMKAFIKKQKVMCRKITSFLLALIMMITVFYGASLTVNAGATGITVSNATYYENGTLRSLTANFGWNTGSAKGRLVLMRNKLRSPGEDGTSSIYGDFTDFGFYGSKFADYDAVLNYDKNNETFGIISSSSETTWSSGGSNNTVTFNFNESDIPLNKNGLYYVYLWTYYYGKYYPDNLVMAINVANGVVQYTPATDLNSYAASAFTNVVDTDTEETYDVTIHSAANMTKTGDSGAETQTGLNSPMTSVVYTANEGYYFPDDYTVASVNGINVSRDSETQITVFGKPIADAEITLTAPTQRAIATYKITVAHTENGTTTTSINETVAGDTVTINANPNDGYEVDSVKYNDGEDHRVDMTNGSYTFTMPEKDVTVTATYKVLKHTGGTETSVTDEKQNAVLESPTVKIRKAVWKNKSLKLSWNKVDQADGYDLFLKKCDGKPLPKTPTLTMKNKDTTSVTLRKIGGKSFDQKKTFKCTVKAYKIVNGKKTYIASAKAIHIAGKNAKYTNAKKVTVKKPSVTLAVGKSSKISAKVVKVNSKKKIIDHVPECRYWSADMKVATVTSKGKIIAKAKGSCYVYVMTANGQYAKVKVTVK